MGEGYKGFEMLTEAEVDALIDRNVQLLRRGTVTVEEVRRSHLLRAPYRGTSLGARDVPNDGV